MNNARSSAEKNRDVSLICEFGVRCRWLKVCIFVNKLTKTLKIPIFRTFLNTILFYYLFLSSLIIWHNINIEAGLLYKKNDIF